MLIFMLIVSIGVTTFIIMNRSRKKGANTFTSLLFSIMFFYMIIPLFLLINEEEMSQYTDLQIYLYDYNTSKLFFYQVIVLVFIMIFYLIYNQTINRMSNSKTGFESNTFVIIKYFKLVGWISLIIGGISFILFLGSLGGVRQALAISELARSFNTQLTEFMPYYASLLIIPARLITLVPIFFMTVYLFQPENKRYFIIMICTFPIAVIFYLFNAGRAPLIAYLLCFLIPILKKRIKYPWPIVILTGFVSLPLLDILDSIFLYFSTGVWIEYSTNYSSYLYQFSFPYKNLINSLDIITASGIRYGQDFITSIISFIPGINFSISYDVTTQYFLGENWKSLGGIPNDLITFSIIEFSLLGVVLFSYLLGITLAKIDFKLSKWESNSAYILVISSINILLFLFVQAADIQPLVRSFLLIALVIGVLISSRKVKSK